MKKATLFLQRFLLQMLVRLLLWFNNLEGVISTRLIYDINGARWVHSFCVIELNCIQETQRILPTGETSLC